MLTYMGGLTFGHFGEDCGESSHKEIRNARSHHTRKTSRTSTMLDLISWQLLRTDPYLNSFSKKEKKSKLLPVEVQNLLQKDSLAESELESECGDIEQFEFLNQLDDLAFENEEE